MSGSKKRKAEERTILKKWEENYLFVENNGKPLCLVCLKTISVAKEYNIKRHCDTLHKHKYKRTESKNVFQNLKSKHEKQVGMMFNFVIRQSSSLAVSYLVACLLAQEIKPFREGELVKA